MSIVKTFFFYVCVAHIYSTGETHNRWQCGLGLLTTHNHLVIAYIKVKLKEEKCLWFEVRNSADASDFESTMYSMKVLEPWNRNTDLLINLSVIL